MDDELEFDVNSFGQYENPYGGGLLNFGGYDTGQDMSGVTEQDVQAAQFAYGSDEQITLADIAEIVNSNVGSHALNWMDNGDGSFTAKGPLANDQKVGLMDTLEGMTDKLSGKFDSASKWIEGHEKTAKLLTGMIGGAFGMQEKRDVAKALAQSRLDEQNNADRLIQEQNQRYSDSIVNRKRTPPKQQQKLARIDGTPVFNNGKIA